MDLGQVPVKTFDSRLRELVLGSPRSVDPQPDGHHWQLVDRADRRLEKIGLPPADRTRVYAAC
jgi:hypothetical protein